MTTTCANSKSSPVMVAQFARDKLVAHDLQKAKQQALLKNHGYNINLSVE